jgi:integrase
MVRHSKQDALSDAEFERLVDAAYELDEPFVSQTLFVLFVSGRLGLRAGELAHIKESWVDWDRQQINIPRHDRCDFGQHGGYCGYCEQQARLAAKNNEDLSYDEALEERWQPKTTTGARAVPFGWDDEIVSVVEAFFEIYDRWPRSRAVVNRRVTKVAEEAGMKPEKVYPHCLRASAGTHHAYKGLSTLALQSLMGWERISTARKYLRVSGGATEKALEEVYEDE